jgi:hypothetical protein
MMVGAILDMSHLLNSPMITSSGGAGGAGVYETDLSGALKVVIVGDERVNATADIISRLQARDPRLQGVRNDSIIYALVDEIAALRVEIERLKQNHNQTVQPREEAPVTGSSFVLKI